VASALAGRPLHAPAHVDVEVMSALARLQRAGLLSPDEAGAALDRFTAAPLQRHDLAPLAAGAWRRTDQLRVADAVYVELAGELGVPVLTTDARLSRVSDLAAYVE
jgi:predicted nucleic acid-binding protein